MTLPVSPNPISISQINTEIGVTATTSATLSYLNGLIKPMQRPSYPNMDAFRGKTYYQKTNSGNCTVNCPSDCNCGGLDSGVNCIISGAVNCVNCDTQRWIQSDCNCGPAYYNCTYSTYSYDCDCDCACSS
jgi:hypothetical protein